MQAEYAFDTIEQAQQAASFTQTKIERTSAELKSWAAELTEIQKRIAEMQAWDRFGVAIGDTVAFMGRRGAMKDMPIATGTIQEIYPSQVTGEIVAKLVDPDGLLFGFTLDRYFVQVLTR